MPIESEVTYTKLWENDATHACRPDFANPECVPFRKRGTVDFGISSFTIHYGWTMFHKIVLNLRLINIDGLSGGM